MPKFSTLCLIALVAGPTLPAAADVLDMQGTDNAARFDQAGKPTRGMTQARVEQNFGTPASRVSPVGDPPITRWDYADFVVYFEYDKVIHTVSKHR